MKKVIALVLVVTTTMSYGAARVSRLINADELPVLAISFAVRAAKIQAKKHSIKQVQRINLDQRDTYLQGLVGKFVNLPGLAASVTKQQARHPRDYDSVKKLRNAGRVPFSIEVTGSSPLPSSLNTATIPPAATASTTTALAHRPRAPRSALLAPSLPMDNRRGISPYALDRIIIRDFIQNRASTHTTTLVHVPVKKGRWTLQ